MTKHYICCYNQETRELEHFEVPKSISVYIRQLECEIKYGRGGVQRLYPGRFERKAFDKEDFDYQTYIEDYK
jgi:hypothetical protein